MGRVRSLAAIDSIGNENIGIQATSNKEIAEVAGEC
jgi:hypothetical protein